MGRRSVSGLPRYVLRHGAGFKYKRAVPKDVRPAVRRGRQRHWIAYLKSRTIVEVAAAAAEIDVAINGLIARWRTLPPEDKAHVAARGGFGALEAMAGVRAALLRRTEEHAQIDLAALDLSSPDVLTMLATKKASKEHAQKERALIERDEHVLSEGKPKRGTLGAIVDVWIARQKPTDAGSIHKRRKMLKEFLEVSGLRAGDPLHAAKKSHARKFRDVLEADPKFYRPTAVGKLGDMRTLFKFALGEVDDDLTNPFSADITIRAPTPEEQDNEEGKRAFTDEEARLVLDGLNKLGEWSARADRNADYSLLVRIMAWHGMRAGEVVQLRAEDIGEEHGVAVIRVRREAGKRKSKASKRDVPIHADMLAEIQAVASKRAMTGQIRLFPTFWQDAEGKPFKRPYGMLHTASNRFLRKRLKLVDEDIGLHSWRHRWRVRAESREVAMPANVSRAIMGHKPGKDVHDAVYNRSGWTQADFARERKEYMDKTRPL